MTILRKARLGSHRNAPRGSVQSGPQTAVPQLFNEKTGLLHRVSFDYHVGVETASLTYLFRLQQVDSPLRCTRGG
jgi:hypothetical protein